MPAHPLLQSVSSAGRLSLGHRLGIIVVVLIAESIVHTFVFQSVAFVGGGDVHWLVQDGLHLLFKFFVAYVVFVSILAAADTPRRRLDTSSFIDAPLSPAWALLHAALVGVIVPLSFAMRANASAAGDWLLASTWLLCGIGAVGALFMALAPARRWMTVLGSFRVVLLSAVPLAFAVLIAIHISQSLWQPAARLTFALVDGELGLILPGLHSDADTQILGTDRFRVFVANACSGMEGLGLTAVFCAVILWLHRRELRFPRALILLPAALILMFLLNSLRIAALVLIGNAGYPDVATVGFHSQAGWILFNLVAVFMAIAARRSSWLSVARPDVALEGAAAAGFDNPVAPYLMPLVLSLAVGMLAKALSAGFDLLYPATLVAAGIALWFYRRELQGLDWRCNWPAIGMGTLVFLIWMLFDKMQNARHDMPDALARLPESARYAWIVCRAVGAIVTVPIVEELAFRGYLLRVLSGRDFESVRFRDVRWPALAGSSILFGVTHGGMWLPGIIAGAAYGWLAIRRDRLGEAVAAHAMTNALLVIAVLVFNDWQLW